MAAEVFAELCTRFQLEDVVKDRILALGITSLSEFRYYVNRCATAGLPHVWLSRRGTTVDRLPLQLDEEDLLPSVQLTGIREVFWGRYKLVFPPEYTPSDRILAKAQRALTKRSLEVVDVWQVRSIATQRLSVSKRRRLAGDIWISGEPDETPSEGVPAAWWGYLIQLRLYLLSLAMAGAAKIDPQPNDAEAATSDTTKYVLVPYDILQKYLCRAESFCLKTPESSRLSRLETLDRAERGEWAHRFANSTDHLGVIIFQVFRDRDSHWVPLALSSTSSSAKPAEPRNPPSKRPAAREFASKLRDGQALCKDYQMGKCQRQRDARCPKGLHRCAVEFASGRVCGSPRIWRLETLAAPSKLSVQSGCHACSGLVPWSLSESNAPVCRQVSDVWSPGEHVPDNSIYIGHGHFRHRFPCTDWCSPFVEGRDGSSHEVPSQFCHGDVLVGAFNQSQAQPVQPSRSSRRSKRLLLGLMVGLRIPAVVANPVTQASLVCGVRHLFPGVVWDGCRWPLVEDLVNTTTFAGFHQWVGCRFPDLDGDLGPQILGRSGVILQRTGVQDQSGAAARKTSVAPLVPFGLSPDALGVHAVGSPLDWLEPTDLDIRFAASQMALGPDTVSAMREFNLRVFQELGCRLQPVSDFLRQQQHPEVRCVNPAVHLALVAVLVLVFAWPDSSFPGQLFAGFPAVGCPLWTLGFSPCPFHGPGRRPA
eukprot:s1013_g26.t1